MVKKNTAYELAQQYIGKGWSVIPIIPGDKKPSVAWTPYRTRLAQDEELQEWFVKSHHDIGIVTGKLSRLVVLDFDANDKLDEFLTRYPTDLVADTPKGGHHLYYEYAGDGLGPTVSKLGYKIDTRAEGGYVVAPSGNGSNRHWKKYGKPASLTTYPALEQQLKLVSSNGVAANHSANEPEIRQAAGKEDGHDLMARVMVKGFTQGQHNEEIKNLGRYLYRQGTAEPAIRAMLWALNQKDPSPLPLHEFDATLRSGIGYEKQRKAATGKTEPEEDDGTWATYGEVREKYAHEKEVWLVDQWLPDSAILVLAAAPGKNKTWLALELAVNVALGEHSLPFLAQFGPGTAAIEARDEETGELVATEETAKTPPMPVAIIQQEDFLRRISRRLDIIISAKAPHLLNGEGVFGNLPLLNNIYLRDGGLITFDNPASLDRLEQFVAKNGIKLVVIDPLYIMADAEDFMASAARSMRRIKDIRDRTGCSFLFVHHNRKSGGNGRDKIWGSQLLNGAFEGAWVIDDQDGQLIVERSGKSFADGDKRFRLTVEIDTTTNPNSPAYRSSVELLEVEALTGKYDEAVIEYLTTAGVVRQGAVAEYLSDRFGQSVQSGQARKVLDRLVEKGFVGTDGADRGPKFWLEDNNLKGI